MLFKEIIGQDETKRRLLQMVKDAKVGHALLFTGREGCGKLGLALAFARYLNCEDPGTDDSCMECSSCRKYSKLVHPDLHLVFPVVETKSSGADPVSDDFISQWRDCVLGNPYLRLFQWYEYIGIEKKQGSISRKESLQIIRKLSFKNFEADRKVMIIWMAEKMNLSAANKLLKVLEEPPPKTVFILIAEDASQIIPTILSRTQLIKIPGIDPESMGRAIREKHGITGQGQVEGLVRMAGGNYLRVMEAVNETEENRFHFDMFVSLMRLCFAVDVVGILAWIDKMADRGRERQKQFFQYALRIIRGNFIQNIKAGNIDLLSEEERNFSDKFSSFVHSGNVFAIYNELNKASEHIEYNGNSRLIFFDLSLRMAKLLKA